MVLWREVLLLCLPGRDCILDHFALDRSGRASVYVACSWRWDCVGDKAVFGVGRWWYLPWEWMRFCLWTVICFALSRQILMAMFFDVSEVARCPFWQVVMPGFSYNVALLQLF